MILHGCNQLPACGMDRDHDLAAARAELHCVVEEVDEHLPKACLVALVRGVFAERRRARHALPFGEEPQPLGRGRREPTEIEIVDGVRPVPLSIRERSMISLTIWTRWPVSTSILAIRSRILGGSTSRPRPRRG